MKYETLAKYIKKYFTVLEEDIGTSYSRIEFILFGVKYSLSKDFCDEITFTRWNTADSGSILLTWGRSEKKYAKYLDEKYSFYSKRYEELGLTKGDQFEILYNSNSKYTGG